jgi:dolichyl-phosphate-mannose--protein O-mannosyl transferase
VSEASRQHTPESAGPALARRDWHWILLLVAIAALCRLPRLGQPPTEVFDEIYHARTALEYVEGRPPTEWVHPPMAKLLIAVGIAAFGYEPWAWRLAPALAGIALVPIFFLLARWLLPSRRAAILATLLLLCDGVYLVQSRLAMTNIFAVLFQLTATLVVLRAVERERLRPSEAVGAGLFLGLALSTRWTSLWCVGLLALVTLAVRRRRLLRPREGALVALAGLALPAMVYVASYVPWMCQGHTLAETVRQQRAVWRYHADLQAEHPYASAWYTWPWLYRPTWYFHERAPDGRTARAIIALGSPPVWLASVPVCLWAVWVGLRRRRPWLLLIGLGFGAMYLPWAIAPRTLNFSHYLFEAIPFACVGLGALLDEHWEGALAQVARGFLALTAILFVVSFPSLTALPLPAGLLDGSARAALLTWLGL